MEAFHVGAFKDAIPAIVDPEFADDWSDVWLPVSRDRITEEFRFDFTPRLPTVCGVSGLFYRPDISRCTIRRAAESPRSQALARVVHAPRRATASNCSSRRSRPGEGGARIPRTRGTAPAAAIGIIHENTVRELRAGSLRRLRGRLADRDRPAGFDDGSSRPKATVIGVGAPAISGRPREGRRVRRRS